MSWVFPLKNWKRPIPVGEHPGSFAAKRKYDTHTGVDLYTHEGDSVYAVEDGTIISIENFTGPQADSPWWKNTKAVLAEGEAGVVCYGEVLPRQVWVGKKISKGQEIAHVVPVLHSYKIRADIPGHSACMLHFELYRHGAKNTVWWKHGDEKPKFLLDPTSKLQMALSAKTHKNTFKRQ